MSRPSTSEGAASRKAVEVLGSAPVVAALLGNPNVGKTTMFNRLVGRSQHTANFPGTTQEAHVGRLRGVDEQPIVLIDLPGVYQLSLTASESRVCRETLEGNTELPALEAEGRRPDAVVVVLDRANLERGLALFGEAAPIGLPMAAILTTGDDAPNGAIESAAAQLRERLACPVVTANRREGVDPAALREAIRSARPAQVAGDPDAHNPRRWARDVAAAVAWTPNARSTEAQARRERITNRIDAAVLHPLLGLLIFAGVMTGLFWVIFRLATYPMDLIDTVFASLAAWTASVLPEGAISSLAADGVVSGVGATLIFLPQIVLLFFLIALLEQSGYLARGSMLVDRLMRPFGLSGSAFVPLLSGHACAIPGIMATRAIADRRERLAAILVLPFMSCTARIPVYVLLTTLLFPGRPAVQALAFTSCYALGIGAGLLSSVVARRSLLRGQTRALMMELPPYRRPELIAAGRLALSRGGIFLKKAGTIILAISVILWWLGTYPKASELEAELPTVAAVSTVEQRAYTEMASASSGGTFLERLGGLAQPVFEPVGADTKLTIGILASLIAREVFVTTMAVQVIGDDEADLANPGVLSRLRSAERADGSLLFDQATSWALLVYFVLAMQCLPTLAVTAREAGGWKWAALQFGWMTGIAYVAAAAVFALVRAFTGS